MVIQYSGSGTGVLERPTGIIIPDRLKDVSDIGESDEALGRVKSSLTVVENPSLYGRLGILMAADTLLSDDRKVFTNAYLIWAGKNHQVMELSVENLAKSELQSGENPLYVLSTLDRGEYIVASELPHETCEIDEEEFEDLAAALEEDHKDDLGDVVEEMVALIGDRVDSFSIAKGKLVLPKHYASTRLKF